MWGENPGTHAAKRYFPCLVEFGEKAAYLDPLVVVQFELCALGSWVIGANMQCKLSVALQLEVAHHFVEGCAGERSRRFEPPPTFGATKTSKTRLLNPYQLASDGCQCRCAQRRLTACPAPACRQGTKHSPFLAAYCLIAAENRHQSGVAEDVQTTKCTCANLKGLSGMLHTRKIFVRPPPVFGCDPSF